MEITSTRRANTQENYPFTAARPENLLLHTHTTKDLQGVCSNNFSASLFSYQIALQQEDSPFLRPAAVQMNDTHPQTH